MDSQSIKKASILVVDDHPTNLKVLVEYLESANYRTLVATRGERALQQIHRYVPDLILLDVLMPDLNGFDTCRLLKANPRTRNIPVIFITALSDVDSIVRGFEAGGVDYITKPIRHQELLARVNTHLTLQNLQDELLKKNKQLEQRNEELQQALKNIKTLEGLLPICAHCKKIRDDEGHWHQVEAYIQDHSEAEFSHGFCPDCMHELYSEFYPSKT